METFPRWILRFCTFLGFLTLNLQNWLGSATFSQSVSGAPPKPSNLWTQSSSTHWRTQGAVRQYLTILPLRSSSIIDEPHRPVRQYIDELNPEMGLHLTPIWFPRNIPKYFFGGFLLKEKQGALIHALPVPYMHNVCKNTSPLDEKVIRKNYAWFQMSYTFWNTLAGFSRINYIIFEYLNPVKQLFPCTPDSLIENLRKAVDRFRPKGGHWAGGLVISSPKEDVLGGALWRELVLEKTCYKELL